MGVLFELNVKALQVTVIDMNWSVAIPPTREAALARIASIQPDQYARTRNALQGAVTGLSPYVTHGVVTLPEVLRGVLERQPLAVGHKLVYELGWREYFRHVWANEGDGILQSMHPGPLPEEAYDPVLPADIREGRTGVPAIDEAVRTLYATGILHNHARMWLASYVVHVRRIHWRAGADWLVAHLLDGDRASNHLSWQWVAGTASSKPYLFNADNVAKYAPAPWHSPGSAIDLPYETLDRIARDPNAQPLGSAASSAVGEVSDEATTEPVLHTTPPAELELRSPDNAFLDGIKGREVWLVHPWALRAPPPDIAQDAVVVGVYLADYHKAWPWPEARWRWVDAAMAAVTEQRWLGESGELAAMLSGAGQVRSVGNPHITPWLPDIVQLEPEPSLFPMVERRCTSFSQWWKRATRGLHQAEELL